MERLDGSAFFNLKSRSTGWNINLIVENYDLHKFITANSSNLVYRLIACTKSISLSSVNKAAASFYLKLTKFNLINPLL